MMTSHCSRILVNMQGRVMNRVGFLLIIFWVLLSHSSAQDKIIFPKDHTLEDQLVYIDSAEIELDDKINFLENILIMKEEEIEKSQLYQIKYQLANYYYHKQNFLLAVKYFKESLLLNSELYQSKIDQQIIELQKKDQLQQEQIETQIGIRNFFAIIFVIFVFIAGFLFVKYYRKNQEHQYLQSQHKKLQTLATKDPLTNLANRRSMKEKLQYEIYRYQRNKKEFSVIISDIDHFKRFNDQFGHDCGDYVLETLSLIITQKLRKQDIIGRWGGEEFLILLPETSIDGAFIVAEKIRKEIMKYNFKYEDKLLSITMTFGISTYNSFIGLKNCVKQADIALYKGKNSGRNCVIAYES